MGAGALRAPWSERVVDTAACLFALWTLSCHAVVWAGGSLHDVMLTAASAAALLAGAFWWCRRRSHGVGGLAGGDAPRAEAQVAPAQPPLPSPLLASDVRAGAARGALLGAGLAAVLLLGEHVVALWWCSVAVLAAAALLFVLPERLVWRPAVRGRGLEAGLWGLAGLCVLITLVAHRIDLDDAFYINLAAAAADDPGAPILAADTLHGVAGLPLHLPVYRLHSYEMWNGALSLVTGLPAIVCFHVVSAVLAALLVPLALARLLRRLTPDTWLWSVAATLFVLVAVGETHRWYGNFAFVRIWQGKGIFLFVFLPLLQSYALDLVRRPRARGWLRLALAQVAAVGCTSSALWAAPAAALAAAASGLRPSRSGLIRLCLVLLASVYVLGVGWGTKRAVESERVDGITATLTPEVERVRRERNELVRHTPGAELEIALGLVAGESRLRTALLAALVAAWALCPAGPARRYAVVVPLAVVVVLLNPYTTRFVTGNLTGPSFWRAFWVLPVPLLMGLVLTAPLQLPAWLGRPSGRPGRSLAWLGPAGVVCAAALFALAVPRHGGLSEENFVDLARPGLKVDLETYRWAELLTERVDPGDVVVAPGDVCVWLSTFRGRAHPLLVRPPYLVPYLSQLGAEDLDLRLLMTNYATGSIEGPEDHERFRSGLERFGVRGVLLRDSPFAARARAILREAGFRPDLKAIDHEIWLRS